MKCIAVILAAGLGTRMKSRLPKVLHPVLGDPSLLWVLRSLPAAVGSALVVVLPQGEARQRIHRAHFSARMEGYPLFFSMEKD